MIWLVAVHCSAEVAGGGRLKNGVCFSLKTMLNTNMREGPFKPNPEELVGEEWAESYRMSPLERWQESAKLWQTYVALGGVLDPEPDTRSPFFDGGACWTVYSSPKRLVPAAHFVHYICTSVFLVI